MKKIEIIAMDFDEYMKKYGNYYKNGDVWDYPLNEINYLLCELTTTKFALINNRLYEII